MINELFDLMDKWRHYPNWQLERRADIFFALYLEKILATTGVSKVRLIIPEFPVRIGEISEVDINKSKKIDYLVLSESEVILVELKTDNSSRRLEQDDYLRKAQEIGLGALIAGVKKIYQATIAKKKYDYLMKDISTIEATADYAKLPMRIIYIQPNGIGSDIVNFETIAKIEAIDGDIGTRFRKSLREWGDTVAGENQSGRPHKT